MVTNVVYSWINFWAKSYQNCWDTIFVDDNQPPRTAMYSIDANLSFEESFFRLLDNFDKADKQLLAKKLETLLFSKDFKISNNQYEIVKEDYDGELTIDLQALINKIENTINRNLTEEELFKLDVLSRIVESHFPCGYLGSIGS